MEATTEIEIVTDNTAHQRVFRVTTDHIQFNSDLQVYFNHEEQMQAVKEVQAKFGELSNERLKGLLTKALLGLHNDDYQGEEISETGSGIIPAVAISYHYSMTVDSDTGFCSQVFVDLSSADFG